MTRREIMAEIRTQGGKAWRRSKAANQGSQTGVAFTLIEMLLVIAIVALLLSVLLPALSSARRTARTVVCSANMRQMGIASQTYSGDWKGLIAGFSWQPEHSESAYPDLQYGPAALRADVQSDQAVDIARKLTGFGATDQPAAPGRVMNRNFWHMPMQAAGYYASRNPFDESPVCPEDRNPILWRRQHSTAQILQFVAEGLTPSDDSRAFELMFRYWGTYQAVACSYSNDEKVGTVDTFYQAPDDYQLFQVNETNAEFTRIGLRRYDECSFPSQKVQAHDLYDRHFYKRLIWFAYPVVRQPLLFFDGSARVKKTGDANPGFQPETPASPLPTQYPYNPANGWPNYDPPSLSGGTDQVLGYYRWTRDGLHGVDYTQ